MIRRPPISTLFPSTALLRSIVGTDVIFSPTLNFNGAASFNYTVQDNGQSGSPLANDFKTDVGAVSFTITAVKDATGARQDTPPRIAADSGDPPNSKPRLTGN